MIRLLTLGGAAIVDDDGRTPAAANGQRRTLALLSALAVSGSAGMTRDKLVALFWPDANPDRARHALTQALYASRRSLNCDEAFVLNGDVRLNPAHVETDVGQLLALLGVDDERAVELYRGPFLDGFYLAGASAFEQWTSAQRSRIEDEIVRALERLAARAKATRDLTRSAEWLKRAAAIHPLDSRLALRLMEALAGSGDRGGAIQHATIHATLLRNELEVEPDAAVVALARSLREGHSAPALARPESSSATAGTSSTRGTLVTSGDGVQPDQRVPQVQRDQPTDAMPTALVRESVRPRDPRTRRWFSVIALAAVVVVTAGLALQRVRDGSSDVRPLPLRQEVVVAPFRVAGADPSLAYLRDGIVELLSTRLADDSSARSVDAGAVLGAWRAAGLTAAMDVPRNTVVGLASQLGVERVVVGGVIGNSNHVVIRATALRVPAGTVAGQATVEGPADSLTFLIDRLAARLLLAEAGEDERLANHVTSSLPALRSFLSAQAAFRANDYTASVRGYEAALKRDSTFGLAALRLAIVADRVEDAETLRRAVRLAWRSRGELTERDAALLLGIAGPQYPAPSTRTDVVRAWQRAADLAPRNAESWFALGSRLFHEGALADVQDVPEQTSRALHRALVLDSNYVPAARLLVQVASDSSSAHVLTALGRRLANEDSLSPLAPFVGWRMAVSQSDSATLDSIRSAFLRLGPTNLRTIAMSTQFDAVELDDGARALAALRGRATSRSRSVDLALAEHSLALNEGRMADALDATRVLATNLPGSGAELRLRVLDALYGGGDRVAGRAAAEELERTVASVVRDHTILRGTEVADACVTAQWDLASDQPQDAQRIASAMESADVRAEIEPISAEPAACAELIESAVAVSMHGRDARSRVARLDSLVLTPVSAGDASAYAPLWVARLHEQLGDRRGALMAIRRRDYMSDWPRYLATTLREEGRLALAVGDSTVAAGAFRRYLALRQSPDAALRAQMDSVRAFVDAVQVSGPLLPR